MVEALHAREPAALTDGLVDGSVGGGDDSATVGAEVAGDAVVAAGADVAGDAVVARAGPQAAAPDTPATRAARASSRRADRRFIGALQCRGRCTGDTDEDTQTFQSQ